MFFSSRIHPDQVPMPVHCSAAQTLNTSMNGPGRDSRGEPWWLKHPTAYSETTAEGVLLGGKSLCAPSRY